MTQEEYGNKRMEDGWYGKEEHYYINFVHIWTLIYLDAIVSVLCILHSWFIHVLYYNYMYIITLPLQLFDVVSCILCIHTSSTLLLLNHSIYILFNLNHGSWYIYIPDTPLYTTFWCSEVYMYILNYEKCIIDLVTWYIKQSHWSINTNTAWFK